jgi:hypothetical protein
MSTVIPLQQPVNPVTELQRDYALLKFGGEIRLVEKPARGCHWADTSNVTGYRKLDGSVLLTRSLETIPSTMPKNQAINGFFASPWTDVFTDITFDPRPTPVTTINLWRGATLPPENKPFPVLQQFLFNVIAGGNESSNEYLLDFLAHMLQKPEEKPGVMIVLLGGQGIGKGTLCKLLFGIWEKTSFQTNQIEHITGRFNNVLEKTYIIWLDEALFFGNRGATDRLKSLITEPMVTIEEKNGPIRSTYSCHRLFAATNAEHFAHIDKDDRRMVYFPVAETYKGNIPYWTTVHHALETELSGLMGFLLQRDISCFRPQQRPASEALVDQKMRSLIGVPAWWVDTLRTGEVREEAYATMEFVGSTVEWEGERFLSTAALLGSYRFFARNRNPHHREVTEHELKQQISKFCPSALPGRRQVGGKQARGMALPSLDQARKEFETYIGGCINWEF